MTQSWNIARIGEYLLRYRLGVMVTVSAGILIFEVVEHAPFALNIADDHFWREILIYAVVIPVLGWIALSVVARSKLDKLEVQRQLDQTRSLIDLLSKARDREELAAVLLQYLRGVVPLTGAVLSVYDVASARYQPAAVWFPGQDSLPLPDIQPASGRCSLGQVARQPEGSMSDICSCTNPRAELSGAKIYCLPLVHLTSPVAILHLYLPENIHATQEQLNFLGTAAPEIALAIDRAQLHEMSILREQAVETEQQGIARDLHDSLGHNLAYLRFKLDQIYEYDSLTDIDSIRHDLEVMRQAADDAYDQMRDTLIALTPEEAPSLSAVMLAHAEKVGERSDLRIHIHPLGIERSFPPPVQRQILYIFREAIANIERHAHAQDVDIELNWAEHGLNITIQDDGQGFDLQHIKESGHYGLTIMKERSEEIEGRFNIASQQGVGTKVCLWFPYVSSTEVLLEIEA